MDSLDGTAEARTKIKTNGQRKPKNRCELLKIWKISSGLSSDLAPWCLAKNLSFRNFAAKGLGEVSVSGVAMDLR